MVIDLMPEALLYSIIPSGRTAGAGRLLKVLYAKGGTD
jgi:hypothetical protein